MKKRSFLFALSAIPFLLASCGNGENASSSDGAGNTSSQSTVSPEFTPPETITDLFAHIQSNALMQEAKSASSFKRTLHVYTQGMFQIEEETIAMEGTAYSNAVSVATGTISTSKYGDPDGLLPDSESSHTFKSFAQFDEATDMFYQVIDHDTDDKSDDTAIREKYQASNASEYLLFTGTNTLATTWNYYNAYLKPNVIAGFDSLSPVISTVDGSVSYRVEDSFTENTGSSELQAGLSFDIVLDKTGAVKSHAFSYVEMDVTNPNLPVKFFSVGDSYTLDYAPKQAYEGGFLNPLDYFMTDYEISLVAYNTYDTPLRDVDPNQFPYDYLVGAEAKNVVPEKALDTKLTIVDSSNREVVNKVEFMDGSSQFGAVGEGTTTLTVRSESGIEKTIEVTVDAPDMVSIEIKVYSLVNFVGENTDLYIYTNPDNTIDEYEVRALTPEIASLTQDDRGYYSGVNHKEGIAKFEVVSKKDPSIRGEVSYAITTKLSEEATLAKFQTSTFTGDLPHEDGKQTIEDAVTVRILGENKASFTFNTDELGHFFEKGKAYEVSYEVNTTNIFDDFIEFIFSPIETSSPSGQKFIYDNISCRFYRNGKDFRFQIATSDTETVYISPLNFSGQIA